jgi:hypothetical protein
MHRPILYSMLSLHLALLLFISPVHAKSIDRVVAYVNDKAITERELNKVHATAIASKEAQSKHESLDLLINRIILIAEARKLRLAGKNNDQLIEQYINIKVKAFVSIREDDVLRYYNENRKHYADTTYEEVKLQIRKLIEDETIRSRLKHHLRLIRKRANIQIMINRTD